MTGTVYTIGHSTHELSKFLELIRRHEVSAIADVRSQPYSRTPHFNRDPLREALKRVGVSYVFLGDLLGARADDPDCYLRGKVQYDRLANSPGFHQGLERVLHGAARYRIALLCAERDPMTCHRAILVARHLSQHVDGINHILADGRVETHRQLESRLLDKVGVYSGELFKSRDETLREAYRLQGDEIAYEEPTVIARAAARNRIP